MSIPAGWYGQPDGRQRYWDGEMWTENFAPGAAWPVPAPPTSEETASPQVTDEQVTPTSYQYALAPPPPPAQAPFQAPLQAPQQAPGQSTGSNGMAIAGFVLALLGALISWIPVVNLGGDFLALLGLIFGVVGLVQSGKRGSGKGMSIAAIILAVATFIVSVLINTVAFRTLNEVVTNLPSITMTPPSSPEVTAQIGNTITLDGTSPGAKTAITAVKVVDPATSTDEFSTPAAGSRYVAVQFQIQNTGTVAYEDSPSNGAKVTDVSGQQFEPAFVEKVSAGPVLPATVKLAPGAKALGYIVFEVPKSSNLTTVQFAMDSGFADSGTWTIR